MHETHKMAWAASNDVSCSSWEKFNITRIWDVSSAKNANMSNRRSWELPLPKMVATRGLSCAKREKLAKKSLHKFIVCNVSELTLAFIGNNLTNDS